ncbi:MAG: hypothetical protein RJB66_1126 [Pseudomonadota bacterium]|jgi:D-alanyl-D-alanine carboxypeptidase/D-alanyl-D-alanine-endopeptidase (penicillin-binding protein 4)
MMKSENKQCFENSKFGVNQFTLLTNFLFVLTFFHSALQAKEVQPPHPAKQSNPAKQSSPAPENKMPVQRPPDSKIPKEPTDQQAALKSMLNKVRQYSGEHSACYLDPGANQEDIKGVNIDHQVRLASVTKLLTSYWVVSRLGPKYQFKTQFIWDPTTAELMIKGSKDPFFGRRRLLLLISDLNKIGIRQINKVYFDKGFRYFQGVENPSNYHTEITQHGGVSREVIAKQLMHLMNTRNWNNEDRTQFASFQKTAEVLGVKVLPFKEQDLKVLEVNFVDNDPLEGRAGVEVFESHSPAVMNYLKILNIHSMNYPADELFYLFGGRQSFSNFLVQKLNLNETDARLFTGSGLPFRQSGDRSDTTTSCEIMIKALLGMKQELAKYKLDLPDIMMIGGIDHGTLNGVYKQAPLKGAVVAKTGTLANALTLSGFVSTNQGRVYFGVFFQTKNIAQARTVRNQVVMRLAKSHGGAKPLSGRSSFQFFSFGKQSHLAKLDPSVDGLK